MDPPVKGFLFPAFNDRDSDIHGMLYFSKMAEELQPDFIMSMFGCTLPLSAKSQKESFHTLIADTLGEDADYEMVKNIHGHLTELVEETKDSPDPLALTGPDVKRLFALSGVPEEKLEDFDRTYEEAAGEKTTLLATNIAGERRFSIETPHVVVKVKPEYMDLIETRIIDGKHCLIITVNDHIEVNGVPVRTITPTDTDPIVSKETKEALENGEAHIPMDAVQAAWASADSTVALRKQEEEII